MTWKLKIAAFNVHLRRYLKRMKIFFTLLISLIGLYSVQAQSNYCKPSVLAENICTHSWIKGVSINNINNQNDLCDKDDFGIPIDDGYSDYSELVIRLDPSVPSLITVDIDGFVVNNGSVWVDWNGDHTFEETERLTLIGDGYVNNRFTAVVATPTGALLDTIIKGGVRVNMNFNSPPLDPCGENFAGEIEDYSFIVTSAPSASGPVTYCDAAGPGDCGVANNAHIVEVTLDDFTNTSAACPSGSGPTYVNYTNLSAEYTLGTNPTALVTIDGVGTETADIYIDWNKDGDFDDAGETFVGASVLGDVTIPIASAAVPLGTTQGETRMRVRVYDAAFDAGAGPCGSTSYGEVEDYTLKILDPDAPKCATLLSPADGAIDVCSETSLVWSSAENTQLYEVLLTYANGDTAQIINVNDTTYYVGNILLPDSTYTWSITSKDTLGGESLDCSSFTFTTTPFASPSFNFASDTVSFCEGLGVTLMPNVANGNGTIQYSWTGDDSFLDYSFAAEPVFTDTIEGVFKLFVEVSDSLNCGATDSVVVEVYDAPELTSFSFTSKDICPGDSVGIEVETSNPIKFFDLYNGIYSELIPSSILSSVLYFNAVDTSLIFNAVVNTAMCRDTVLMDTVQFHANVAQPTVVVELPSVGPCEGDSVLLISSYDNNIEWINGTTNDSLYVKNVGQEAVEFTFGNGACAITSDTVDVAIDTYPFVPILSADKSEFCEGDSAIVSHNSSDNFIWSNGDAVNKSFVVFVTDSFSVTAVSPLGCETKSDTIFITANANPFKPEYLVSGLVNQLCEGEPVTVSTENTNILEWSTGESTASIVVDTDSDVWLKVINEFGCSTNSDTVTLTFGDQPERPEIIKIEGTTMDSLQCSVVGATYNWFFESQPLSYTARTIPLEEAGVYRVNLITANGCVSELSTGFTNVGILEASEAGIKVLSNLTQWNIVSEVDVQEFILLDVSGKILKTEKNSNTIVVNKGVTNSLLILKVKTANGLYTIKLK
jgi:hypothetical protein